MNVRLNGTGLKRCTVRGCKYTSHELSNENMCPYHWAELRHGEKWADLRYPEYKEVKNGHRVECNTPW